MRRRLPSPAHPPPLWNADEDPKPPRLTVVVPIARGLRAVLEFEP